MHPSEWGQVSVQIRAPSGSVHIGWMLLNLNRALAMATSDAAAQYIDSHDDSDSRCLWVSLSNWPTEGITTSGLFAALQLGSGAGRGYTCSMASALPGGSADTGLGGIDRRFAAKVLEDGGFIEFQGALDVVTPEILGAFG